MKTLDELWKENGEKPGLKVSYYGWGQDWFCIMGQSPKKEFYGYDHMGSAEAWSGDEAKWSLYQEPKKKKVMYNAVFEMQGSCHMPNNLFSNEQEAKDKQDVYGKFIRLLTEYPIEVVE